MIRTIFSSFFLAAALCLPGFPAAADRASEDRQLLRAAENEFDNRVDLETPVLSQTPGRVRREGRKLVLTLSEGSDLVLTDEPQDKDCDDEPAACRVYILAADLPSRHAILVHMGYYEGGDWLLIDDRTGERTLLPSVPHFSPEGERLFVSDIDLAYGDIGIAIWRREGRVWVKEWSLDSPFWYASFLAWEGDRIDLELWRDWTPDGKPIDPWPATLTKDGSGWRMDTFPTK